VLQVSDTLYIMWANAIYKIWSLIWFYHPCVAPASNNVKKSHEKLKLELHIDSISPHQYIMYLILVALRVQLFMVLWIYFLFSLKCFKIYMQNSDKVTVCKVMYSALVHNRLFCTFGMSYYSQLPLDIYSSSIRYLQYNRQRCHCFRMLYIYSYVLVGLNLHLLNYNIFWGESITYM